MWRARDRSLWRFLRPGWAEEGRGSGEALFLPSLLGVLLLLDRCGSERTGSPLEAGLSRGASCLTFQQLPAFPKPRLQPGAPGSRSWGEQGTGFAFPLPFQGYDVGGEPMWRCTSSGSTWAQSKTETPGAVWERARWPRRTALDQARGLPPRFLVMGLGGQREDLGAPSLSPLFALKQTWVKTGIIFKPYYRRAIYRFYFESSLIPLSDSEPSLLLCLCVPQAPWVRAPPTVPSAGTSQA